MSVRTGKSLIVVFGRCVGVDAISYFPKSCVGSRLIGQFKRLRNCTLRLILHAGVLSASRFVPTFWSEDIIRRLELSHRHMMIQHWMAQIYYFRLSVSFHPKIHVCALLLSVSSNILQTSMDSSIAINPVMAWREVRVRLRSVRSGS